MRTADQPQRPESREPTTVAGDNLLTDIIQDHEGPSYHVIERIRWGILAIESEARAAERTESWERMRLLEAVAAAAERSCRTYDTASDGTQTRITPTEANSRRLDVVYALTAFRALAADPLAPEPSDV